MTVAQEQQQGRPQERIVAMIDSDLDHRLEIQAAHERRPKAHVIASALAAYIAEAEAARA